MIRLIAYAILGMSIGAVAGLGVCHNLLGVLTGGAVGILTGAYLAIWLNHLLSEAPFLTSSGIDALVWKVENQSFAVFLPSQLRQRFGAWVRALLRNWFQ